MTTAFICTHMYVPPFRLFILLPCVFLGTCALPSPSPPPWSDLAFDDRLLTRLIVRNAGPETIDYEWASRALEMSRELRSDSLAPGDSVVLFLPLFQPVRTYLFTAPGGRANLHLLPGIHRRVSWDGQHWREDSPLYCPLRRLETELPMQGPETPYTGSWEEVMAYYGPREKELLEFADSLRRAGTTQEWLTDLLEQQIRLGVAAEIETIRGYQLMREGTIPALPDTLEERINRLLANSALVEAPAYHHLQLRHHFLQPPQAANGGDLVGAMERNQLEAIIRELPVTEERRHDFLARFVERGYHDARAYGTKSALIDKALSLLPPAYLNYLTGVKDSIDGVRSVNQGLVEILDAPLVDRAGRQVIPRSIYSGRPVLYKFWFPGCIPCRRQYPFERRLREEFPRLRLVYLAYATPEERWHAYLDRHATPADRQLYWDVTAEGAVARGLNSSPRYVLFGTSGAVICARCPPPSDPALSAALSTLD